MNIYYAKGSERNKKISEKNKGKKVPQELRDRISSKLKGVYCRENNPNKRKVVKLTLDGKFICEYESLSSAARDVGGRASHISRCCRGKLGKHKGFKWMYFEDYPKKK
ncbi:hypothetical protein [Terrisporobacter sp.]|uniref:hypothetical protein n=1 Tax=Terrisporobacter sp. TaxID=1965305 RepID=UPI0026283D65|nr:hypothetical protein [Terrisporobacter sp.]